MNAQTIRYLAVVCLGLCLLAIVMFRFDFRDVRTTISPVEVQQAPPRAALASSIIADPVSSDDYRKMLSRIKAVQRTCGKLCDSNLKGTPSKFFDNIRVPVDCEAIFKQSLIDAPREQQKAPHDLPKEYLDDFTMHGRFPFDRYQTFFDEVYLTGNAAENRWTKDFVEGWRSQASQGTLGGTYGAESTNTLMRAVKKLGVIGKRCLVIGSERPWVEAVLLAAGAREVVTLEYGKIFSTHPQVVTMLPSEFTEGYLNGSLGLFDSVVTFSSVEHVGLGRYGDALLPWGDILAIARGWCVTKPKGDLVINVPVGPDVIMFNAHRVYGPVRYPFLAVNWEQVDKEGDVYIFSKQDPI